MVKISADEYCLCVGCLILYDSFHRYKTAKTGIHKVLCQSPRHCIANSLFLQPTIILSESSFINDSEQAWLEIQGTPRAKIYMGCVGTH